jgi:hypothetical protein
MLGGDDLTETRAREREQHRREQRLRIATRRRAGWTCGWCSLASAAA